MGHGPPFPHSAWPGGSGGSVIHTPPRRQLREEDECPVCHLALPPKGSDGSENERESHINLCIEARFSRPNPRHSHSQASSTTLAADGEHVAGSSLNGAPGAPGALPSGALQLPPSIAMPKPRRRTTGMVVYHATEKDCVGEDGEGAAECVICFEEFAVGDEMGRLECLCKFHKVRHLPCSIDLTARIDR